MTGFVSSRPTRRPNHKRCNMLGRLFAATLLGAALMTPAHAAPDVHSFANADEVRVTHVALDLDVKFEQKVLEGSATLDLERIDADADTVVLDTRALDIRRAEAFVGDAWQATTFTLGEEARA